MSKYLIQGSYTQSGIQGVLKEGGTSRQAATERLAASLGAKVEAYYFAFGSDDFIIIVDAPSPSAVAAMAMTAAASGAIHAHTTVLLTPEELDAATKLSPVYRPPGQ